MSTSSSRSIDALARAIGGAASEMDRHAQDIGYVAIAWNTLQDTLGELFAAIASPDRRFVGFAVWHSVKSDRYQRGMLEAAAREGLGEDHDGYQAIKWMLGQLDRMENERNNAIHSPYSIKIGDAMVAAVVPATYSRNPRAQRLKDRDLRMELKSYRDHFSALTGYANEIHNHLVQPKKYPTLPSKPRLPGPAHTISRNKGRSGSAQQHQPRS